MVSAPHSTCRKQGNTDQAYYHSPQGCGARRFVDNLFTTGKSSHNAAQNQIAAGNQARSNTCNTRQE
jgi:hypothetical protein